MGLWKNVTNFGKLDFVSEKDLCGMIHDYPVLKTGICNLTIYKIVQFK